jgi:hypothetical protein
MRGRESTTILLITFAVVARLIFFHCLSDEGGELWVG